MPVLVRLDEDLAPVRASVDGEGALLRLEGVADPAERAARVQSIVEEMGYTAEPVDDTSQVSRWFGADDVDELSRMEAQVLAERWVDELVAENLVAEPRRLIVSLRSALLRAFRTAARLGSDAEVSVDAAAFRGALDEAEAERIVRWIQRKLGRPA